MKWSHSHAHNTPGAKVVGHPKKFDLRPDSSNEDIADESRAQPHTHVPGERGMIAFRAVRQRRRFPSGVSGSGVRNYWTLLEDPARASGRMCAARPRPRCSGPPAAAQPALGVCAVAPQHLYSGPPVFAQRKGWGEGWSPGRSPDSSLAAPFSPCSVPSCSRGIRAPDEGAFLLMPPGGGLGYCTCAQKAIRTKRRKKIGSLVAQNTIGTSLSQEMATQRYPVGGTPTRLQQPRSSTQLNVPPPAHPPRQSGGHFGPRLCGHGTRRATQLRRN